MDHLSIDLETYSSVDLKKSGLYKYVQSPDFEILLFGFSFNGSPAQIVDMAQGETLSNTIITMLQHPDVIKHAYNAAFEWYCLSKYFNLYNPAAWLPHWRCTMFHGLYCGYPGQLAQIGPAIGLPEDKRKLGIGKSLINTFCKPCTPTAKNGNRTRTLPHHEPEKWALFKRYCIGDVVTEMEVEHRLASFPVPEAEQKLWELDQIINLRGVAVDQELINGALAIDAITTAGLMNEAYRITKLNNPKSTAQLKKWLEDEMNKAQEESDEPVESEAEDQPIVLQDLTKNTVKELLKTTNGEDVRRMLEIRQELNKTSVKKYTAMKNAVCSDGRIRGLLQIYGANRTGRFAGRLVQIQNLPQNHLPAIEWAREAVKARRIDDLKLIYGNIPDTLSQLIRTAFIPLQGNDLEVSDFSAIEARIIAWLADEKWRLEVFATHGKIYEASAANMFGIPIESIDKKNPKRQIGKVAELALGFQGSVGALKSMRKTLKISEKELPDEILHEIVQRWRAANKRICDLWYVTENAALDVMRTGQPVGINKGIIFAREADFNNCQDFLTIKLPNGRKLYYVKPFLQNNDFNKEALHYWGLNQKTKKWEITSTYGGKLVENIVQAMARDCLTESMKRLSNKGIVMHVHDELIIETPENQTNLDDIYSIMSQPIPWAPGLLLRADGFITKYYKKDD